jgi:chaperonin cofactor prefoldin
VASIVAEGFAAMDKRFDALEVRMDRIEARVYAIEKRLDSLEAEVRIINDRLDKYISPTLDDHARRIKDLETAIA